MLKILAITVALLFSGCATDGVYNVGKTVYIGGKAVVIANADLLPQETLDKLEKADEIAARYDTMRTSVKQAIEADSNASSSSSTGSVEVK